jgi:hypothetical protein
MFDVAVLFEKSLERNQIGNEVLKRKVQTIVTAKDAARGE